MKELSDWELVARARSGQNSAFEELVLRYQRPVIGFCQRMVGSLQDAEDLAQECFVRLHRYLPRLKPRAGFSTVLFGMARNLTLNFLRDTGRRGRGRTESMTLADESQRAVEDPMSRPDRQAQVKEIEAVLEQVMERLSPEHREVLILREFHGLDYDAIAKVVRCRQGTVKSRLARAREQLRLQLEGYRSELR